MVCTGVPCCSLLFIASRMSEWISAPYVFCIQCSGHIICEIVSPRAARAALGWGRAIGLKSSGRLLCEDANEMCSAGWKSCARQWINTDRILPTLEAHLADSNHVKGKGIDQFDNLGEYVCCPWHCHYKGQNQPFLLEIFSYIRDPSMKSCWMSTTSRPILLIFADQSITSLTLRI